MKQNDFIQVKNMKYNWLEMCMEPSNVAEKNIKKRLCIFLHICSGTREEILQRIKGGKWWIKSELYLSDG